MYSVIKLTALPCSDLVKKKHSDEIRTVVKSMYYILLKCFIKKEHRVKQIFRTVAGLAEFDQ